jgi:hypothetical protein
MFGNNHEKNEKIGRGSHGAGMGRGRARLRQKQREEKRKKKRVDMVFKMARVRPQKIRVYFRWPCPWPPKINDYFRRPSQQHCTLFSAATVIFGGRALAAEYNGNHRK